MVTIADKVTAQAIAPMTMPTSAPVVIPDFEFLPISATIVNSMRTAVDSLQISYSIFGQVWHIFIQLKKMLSQFCY